jgi:hypothetical protein
MDLGIVEVIASLRVITFCKAFGHQQVVLEGDVFQPVQILRKEDKNLNKYGHLIEETRRGFSCLQQ